MKNVCFPNNTIKNMKRQSTEWEKVFANHMSDDRLAFRIYKAFLKFNYKKQIAIKNEQRI